MATEVAFLNFLKNDFFLNLPAEFTPNIWDLDLPNILKTEIYQACLLI